MIEHVIVDRLKTSADVTGYCNGNIFSISAPDGTRCPYIVVKDSPTRNEDDVITMFDVGIEIYDYDVDKRKILAVSQKIKNLLNEETFQDPSGIYSNIRVWYVTSNSADGNDPNLTILSMQFSARACEELEDNNLIL